MAVWRRRWMLVVTSVGRLRTHHSLMAKNLSARHPEGQEATGLHSARFSLRAVCGEIHLVSLPEGKSYGRFARVVSVVQAGVVASPNVSHVGDGVPPERQPPFCCLHITSWGTDAARETECL